MSSVISRRTVIAGGLATAAALTLAACSKSGKGEVKGIKVDGDTATITIGATPKPHVEILKWVQDNLTKGSGIKLDIKEINDYQTPNSSLEDGSLAANFYQTPNFLAQQNKEKGYDFVYLHLQGLQGRQGHQGGWHDRPQQRPGQHGAWPQAPGPGRAHRAGQVRRAAQRHRRDLQPQEAEVHHG